MIFYGEPNQVISDAETNRPLFTFDGEGKFNTAEYAKRAEENLIKRLKPFFKFEEEAPVVAVSEFTCTICGKDCNSKIGLTGHMRTHKGGD